MQYPLNSEYLSSIHMAEDTLKELTHLTPVMDHFGEPTRSSGAFAIVFKMQDKNTGKYYALKCFTADQPGRAEAYRMIADELDMIDSPYITSVKYLEDELFVESSTADGEEFPVLLMDWVEGVTMDKYISDNVTDSHAMAMLCYRFCRMAAWLRSQPFAHGDLKPDNIIVRADGTLTLVDYDGMYVPAMRGQKSPTLGTRDFTHPERTADDFDETIDDFALACIALSLKAFSLDGSLYSRHNTAEGLLFDANDYQNIAQSPVLDDIKELLWDKELSTIYGMFIIAHARKNLANTSFLLFQVERPNKQEMEVISTEKPTDEELEEAFTDKFGVKYSKDGKRLLKATEKLKGYYIVRKGTKVIYDEAFANSHDLTSIILPDTLTTIGHSAFSGCNSLIYVNLPDALSYIGNSVFSGCTSLAKIRLPQTLTTLGHSAFKHCISLTEIYLPDTLTTIGGSAFWGCQSLKYINLPDKLTAINDSTFSGCTSLTEIRLPRTLTTIGHSAFERCSSLRDIYLPDTLTTIGGSAFWGCQSLKYINLPDKLTAINDSTFNGCTSLTEIHLPKTLTTIEHSAFKHCISLTEIYLPDTLTTIGSSAFWECESLKNINLPDKLTSIGNYTFCFCTSLTTIKLPNGLKEIGSHSFAECWNLNEKCITGVFGFKPSATLNDITGKIISWSDLTVNGEVIDLSQLVCCVKNGRKDDKGNVHKFCVLEHKTMPNVTLAYFSDTMSKKYTADDAKEFDILDCVLTQCEDEQGNTFYRVESPRGTTERILEIKNLDKIKF